MASLTVSHCLHWKNSSFMSGIGNVRVVCDVQKTSLRQCSSLKLLPRASAARRTSGKKVKKDEQPSQGVAEIPPEDRNVRDDSEVKPPDNSNAQKTDMVPSRDTVLRACTVTSGLIAAFGVLLQQVSHLASTEGLPIPDCSSKVSFDFEIWHLEVITGLVIVISSCRYLLLKTWPDFAESSDTANQQVLSLLEPLDYVFVAFLSGSSEELLFRGALLPLLGFDWKSVLVVATIFGVLHIGGGRKFSFAVWATFVGLMYGYATVVSSSLIVPMASHAANNLIGGLLWRYESSKKM